VSQTPTKPNNNPTTQPTTSSNPQYPPQYKIAKQQYPNHQPNKQSTIPQTTIPTQAHQTKALSHYKPSSKPKAKGKTSKPPSIICQFRNELAYRQSMTLPHKQTDTEVIYPLLGFNFGLMWFWVDMVNSLAKSP